jgi:PAT family beta-lactamase induction signal transducer AmpG
VNDHNLNSYQDPVESPQGRTLSDNATLRGTTLCALYFAQGLPWGFMTVALTTHLTAQGMTLKETGWLLSMSTLPWTFKLAWAPIIDTLTVRSMGRRRPWILTAQLMMAVTMLTLVSLGNLGDQLTLLGWMFFLHNCFASLQDVSTDALAIDILQSHERGRINGLMWGSKIVGVGFGTAAIGTLLARTNLEVALMVQTGCLLAIMMLPLWLLERPGDKRFPWSSSQQITSTMQVVVPRRLDRHHAAKISNQNLHLDLWKGLSVRCAYMAVIFTTVIHVGQGVNTTLIQPLYTQDLQWTAERYAQIDGTLGMLVQFLAAILGGYLGDRFGQRTFMVIGYTAFAAMAATFGICEPYWTTTWFATAYLVAAPAALAMGTVSALSLYMRISWTRAAATMFTSYMALLNVGDTIGKAWLASRLRESYDYPTCFCLVGLISIIPLALLIWMDPQDVERARQAEGIPIDPLPT